LECGSLLPLSSGQLAGREEFEPREQARSKKAAASCRTLELAHSKTGMRDWPHSPKHVLPQAGAFMVTAASYLKRSIFRGADRLEYLCDSLLELAEKYHWELQAWAVFPNHYHFVAFAAPDAVSLARWTKHLHSVTAIQANRWDETSARTVWFRYWDTLLTFPESYFARLSYVHRNAVHHGVVREASLYPWCSAGWFQRRAPNALYKRVMGMKIDRVKAVDDFEVRSEDVSEALECGSLLPLL
jgi:putative transposase